MIRLITMVRRRSELSLSEFQQSWRDEHGPLVASHQSRLGILRYTQTHWDGNPVPTAVAEARGSMEPAYDGVNESWWESEETLIAALQSRAGEEILASEKAVSDMAESPVWVAHEYPQFSLSLTPYVARPNSTIVKGHFTLRQRADLTLAEAQLYWRTVHGPLIRSMSPILGLLAYQQVHRFESPVEEMLRNARGTAAAPYLGHAEMWYDQSVVRRAPEIVIANQRAAEDEANFIDFARSVNAVGKEHVFVDAL
ncbi:EthD domain-containing protein [Williamsia soli]|uniref:EthD domain-containing protein n=1 Tax=Williamsia soli TaxID=364929 RepID=UPI001A9EA9CF|nr:EthD domain-containing protein [Williamsia soli]